MNRKNYICILATISLFAFLCMGCQKNPQSALIIGKNNDGVGNISVESSPEFHDTDSTQAINIMSDFLSSDSSVNFHLEINDTIPMYNMPVVQVQPHSLTAEDANHIAHTLFPGSVFYEAEPDRSYNFSKDEIQTKIQRWSLYSNESALRELYGQQKYGSAVEVIKEYIARYTELYESAPQDNPHKVCQWVMQKTSNYLVPADELIGVDISNDNDEISAKFTAEGIPYYFTATTRNKDDFKVNMVSVSIYDGISPSNIDSRIFRAQLCRGEEPGADQIGFARKTAEELLSNLNFGDWIIDECYVGNGFYEHPDERVIYVKAVPVFNNVPVLRRPQLASLRNEDGYAASQYYTEANFEFAPSGKIISFTLYTPLDIQSFVTNNAKVMSIEELVEKSQELLRLTDAYAYGFGMLLDYVEEEVECSVKVSDMEYGLSRIKVPNQDNCYYYVPSILLKGWPECIGKESGTTYYYSEVPETLMVINALDGSIINSTNA